MEKITITPKIPNTDSIAELADFWDTHDLTDFEDQLEEMSEPVFERKQGLVIPLAPQEIEAIQQMAQSEGVELVDLVHGWLLEKIQAVNA
jgi:predicted phosphatase